jgi:hypothetical protein
VAQSFLRHFHFICGVSQIAVPPAPTIGGSLLNIPMLRQLLDYVRQAEQLAFFWR